MSTFKIEKKESKKSQFIFFGVFIFSVLILFSIHLFFMQVVESFTYQNRASFVSSRSQIILSPRGTIFDRHLIPIASNQSSYALQVTPGDIGSLENRSLLIQSLAQTMDLPLESIEQLIPLPARNYDPVLVFSNVEYSTVSTIAESLNLYPGLSWIPRPKRTYPYGDLFAHITGYVGDINPAELQILFNQGYNQNSVIGKSGVENIKDLSLKGEDGLSLHQVDVFGRRTDPNQNSMIREPDLGDSVVLTIDRNIQELTSKALGNRIGSAIVLKPRSGEILAMVSNPTYDPNTFYDRNGSQNFSRVSSSPNSPFLNRTIQAAAPPASTFKVLMGLIALEENLIDPLHTIRCTGSITIGDRVFRCHNPRGHGNVNLYEALAESCNVYFYTLGYEKMTPELIFDYAQLFGFGQLTGIELPSEVRGLVPSRDWKERTFNTPWVGGDTVNISIGQGFLTVTPIQIANLMAAISNGGTVYTPHVIKEIRDSLTNEIINSTEPQVFNTIDISTYTLEHLRVALRSVITDGTADVVITTSAVEVAGKTGTAQTGIEDNKHSWFAAYAPYNQDIDTREPVVVVVWIDAVNEWDWWAPKAANIILHGIFNDMNYEQVIQNLWPLWYISPEMRIESQQ